MTYKYFFFLLLISYVNSFIVSYNYNKVKPLLLSKDKYTDYTNFLNKNKYDKGTQQTLDIPIFLVITSNLTNKLLHNTQSLIQ